MKRGEIWQETEEHEQQLWLDKEPYQMRYFFEHIYCLWSENDKARDQFNYPVDLRDLPLSLATISQGEALIEFWDGPFNWGSGREEWTAEQYRQEVTRFKAEAQAYFELLQAELGSGFVLQNLFMDWETRQ